LNISSDHDLNKLADKFNVLSHPTRLKLLLIVAAMGDITISNLAGHLGLTVPRVSELITQLYQGGFLTKTRMANYVSVSLDSESTKQLTEFLTRLTTLSEKESTP